MAKTNPNKAITAVSNGIVISFRDANKNKFIPYENETVTQIQIFGTSRYQKTEQTIDFSPVQADLYQKVVYGFKAYSKEEMYSMSELTRINITVKYTKAQRILQRWKQELIFKSVDDFLMALFPRSETIKKMIQVQGYLKDDNDTDANFISFEEIGISKKQIANKLIEFGLLPKNFYQLT